MPFRRNCRIAAVVDANERSGRWHVEC